MRHFKIAADKAAGIRNTSDDKQKRAVQKKKTKVILENRIACRTEQRLKNERIIKELKDENERLRHQLTRDKKKAEKVKKKSEVIIFSTIIGCIIVCGPIISGEIQIDTQLSLKAMINAFAEGAATTAIIAVIGLISGVIINLWAVPSKSKVIKYIKIAVIMTVVFVGISFVISQIPAYHIQN